jgi:hypothetical protein
MAIKFKWDRKKARTNWNAPKVSFEHAGGLRTTTSNSMSLVPLLDSKFAIALAAQCANFGAGH